MNCSATGARRKWPCRGGYRRQWAMVTAAAVMLASFWHAGAGAAVSRGRPAAVPLPRPRPAEAPPAKPEGPADGQETSSGAKPPAAAPPAREVSACRAALSDAIAIAPSIPDIHGPGGCGGEDLVRLEAVVLPDKHQVAVKPAAILRCEMASVVADWIRTDMTKLAKGLGSGITELDNFDSFECRGRNRIAGARLSEHGRANALDVRSFALANGRAISLTDRTVPREVREALLRSACARFTTVLGPGSDGYHEDHIHLDLMERRNGYRICQWDIWEALPQIAPMLPAPRPEGAPPREVAAKPDGAEPDADESDANRKQPAESSNEKPAKKKRR
jgi:hypothetical protein